MRTKSTLTLMEQIVMLLVFALAAVLCLQMFVLTGQMSRRMQAKDEAVTMVQNTAEAVKLCCGDMEQAAEELGGSLENGNLILKYDEEWNLVSMESAEYVISVAPYENADALMGKAVVSAEEKGNELFSLTVAWQEETYE